METTTTRRTEVLGDTLRRFVRRGAKGRAQNLLAKARPEDVAVILLDFTPAEQLGVFEILLEAFPETAGQVLTETEPPIRLTILESLSPQQIAGILEPLPVDDAVFLIESLPAAQKEDVLEVVDRSDLVEVQSHLTYGDDTAGRLMDTEYFALPESTTVKEAIAAVQQGAQIEMIFYLYVVDLRQHLVGVTSLRQLLLSPPDRTLGQIMQSSVINVHTDTDQEEVAQLATRYDFLAIPVTDEQNHLMGIVTFDDVIDVVKEEATEDFYKMVGTSDDELIYQEHAFRVARIRLPWLIVNLFGLGFTGLLLERFQVSLNEALFLLTFVPVIMGMGGNLGSQTSTIAVRGLATGRIADGLRSARHFVWQQLKAGVLIGLVCSALVAVVAMLLRHNPYYALVVGTALLVAMTIASVNGAMFPIMFQRMGIDPAVASAPLVTTFNDITGILIYFGLASGLIDLLVH